MAGAAAGAAIFGAIMTVSGQEKARRTATAAAREEKRVAREEAAIIEAETAESVRRAKDKAAKVEGESRAKAAASGFQIGTGSIDLALTDMSDEHARQITWMAKAGAAQARMAIMGGDMRSDARKAQADQLKTQMWGTAAQGVGTAYGTGYWG